MPEWMIAVIIVAILLVVSAVVCAIVRVRKHRSSSTKQALASTGGEAPVTTTEQPTITEIPRERQPVAPADQAQGFGWMRASDLANQKKKP